MPRAERIGADARIVQVIGPRACWVELSNGHRLVAWVSRRRWRAVGPLECGRTIRVEIAPYDVSQGRMTVSETGQKHESPSISETVV